MSYLDPPRFSFYGTFTANPSTINNSLANFSPDAVYDTSLNFNDPNAVLWNPTGWAFFTIPPQAPGVAATTVTSACPSLGTLLIPKNSDDPILGAQIVSIPSGQVPHQARILDLDPDQQSRSMIVALTLQITTADGVTITGTVQPMTIVDVWGRVQGGSAGGIQSAGCMYQSVLENVQFLGIENTRSTFLEKLFKACNGNGGSLSIKFNVDQFNGIAMDPSFTQGRIVGTIGPVGTLSSGVSEPKHVLAQRRMYGWAPVVQSEYPPPSSSPLNAAPFQISGNYLTLDLGNSIPTQVSATNPLLGGAFSNLGPFVLVIDPAGQNVPFAQPLFSNGDEFNGMYTTCAGIYDILLDGQQQQLLASSPLGVLLGPPPASTGAVLTPHQVARVKEGRVVFLDAAPPAPGGALVALAENPNGLFASLDFNALRLATNGAAWVPETASAANITASANIPMYATSFGVPATVSLNVWTVPTTDGTPGAPPNSYVNNAPATAVSPQPVWTNPPSANPPTTLIPGPTIATAHVTSGYGVLPVAAGNLTQEQLEEVQNGRRSAMTSQLYFYSFDGNMDTSSAPLTLLVFVNTPGNPHPTWDGDIYPILHQYARLYPGMEAIFAIDDEPTVTSNIGVLRTVFNLPMEDPGLMPVTRDLSPSNLAMINTWLASQSGGNKP